MKNALNVFSLQWTILGSPGTCFWLPYNCPPHRLSFQNPQDTKLQPHPPRAQCRLPVCGVTFLPLDPWRHPRVSNTNCWTLPDPTTSMLPSLPTWRTWTSWPSRCPEGPPCNQLQRGFPTAQRDGKPLAGRHPSSTRISILLGRNPSASVFPTLKQRQGNAEKRN